jgi:hypothetical protein
LPLSFFTGMTTDTEGGGPDTGVSDMDKLY